MTAREASSMSTCPSPLDWATLTDYWLGLLSAAEEATLEEHLLECDACGNRLRDVMQLSEALARLARSGALRVVVGDALVTHAVEAGRQVRRYDVTPGQIVPCTISEDDELLIGRLAADLAGAGRVDLSFCDPNGVERQRMADIPVRADAGAIVLHESATFAKASPTTMLTARLLAVDPGGTERLLGEYRFNHTRTIPGPAGWQW